MPAESNSIQFASEDSLILQMGWLMLTMMHLPSTRLSTKKFEIVFVDAMLRREVETSKAISGAYNGVKVCLTLC